jgi:hypothetical protein
MRHQRILFAVLFTVIIGALPTTANAQDTPGWLQGVSLPGQATPYAWLRLKINIPARELHVIESNRVIATYSIAIGQARYPSPTMSDDINRIIWNPSWVPPNSPWARGSQVAPPGPRNPLGPVKMPIAQGILIHGTNKPRSIGRAASHGCFRMNSEEAKNLAWYIQERFSTKTDPSLWARYQKYRRTTAGVTLTQRVPVDVVYETVEVRNNRLYLYPDVYRKVRNWKNNIHEHLTLYGFNTRHVSDATIAQLTKRLNKGPFNVSLRDLINGRIAEAQ